MTQVDRAAIDDILPLTGLQEAIVYHSTSPRAEGEVDPYLIIAELDLDPVIGPVDTDRLRAAIGVVVDRHAALRTSYTRRRTGAPVARVHTDVRPHWREVTLDGSAGLADLRDQQRHNGIDLTTPSPARWTIGRLAHADGEQTTTLTLVVHHVALDGWSVHRVLGEVVAAYRGDHLPPVRPLSDFLRWLSDQPDDLAVWMRVLDGAACDSFVPIVGSDHESLVVTRQVGAERSAALRSLATAAGATLNTLIELAWARVLADVTDTDDVVFGSVVSGRHPALEGVDEMVGMLINTVPARITINPAETARQALTRIQRERLALIDHHHTPLADIASARRTTELFNSIVVFESFPRGAVRPRMFDDNTSAATLLVEDDPDITLLLESRGAAPELIDAVLGHLDAILADPDRPLGAVRAQRPSVPTKTSVSSTVTGEPPGDIASVPEQIHHAAQCRRRHAAVVHGDRKVGYRELDEQAAALAAVLRARGVGAESVVALELSRGIDMVVALLAVLRVGAAYLPIDPTYPARRRDFMRTDTAPALVLRDSDVAEMLAELSAAGSAESHEPGPINPDTAAYVVYTSGSTGTPKGVIGTHRALAHRIAWAARSWTGPQVLAKSSIAFIDGTTELLGALAAGATVVLADDDSARDAGRLADLVRSAGIDQITAVPSLARAVVEALSADGPSAFPGPQRWIVSGEPLPETTAAKLGARGEVVNSYGSSEVAGDVCVGVIDTAGQPDIHVGQPVPGTTVRILDRHLAPVAVGTPGELYVSGPQVARGYLGRPGWTSTRFVATPDDVGVRMYRTGDRAVRTADGRIVLLGRTDSQVKIRGHRVEIGEVESAVLAADGVDAVAVTSATDADGDTRIDAYIVGSASPETVADAVRSALPAAMVPRTWTALDALPLTPGGKIDRRALPVPRMVSSGNRLPRTDFERVVVDVVAEVLRIDAPGVDADFFDLGGHSLSATRVVTQLRVRTGTRLTVADVFDHPRLADIATLLGPGSQGPRSQPDAAPQPEPEPVPLDHRPDPIPLSPSQRSLYFQAAVGDSAYTVPFAVRLQPAVDLPRLTTAWRVVVARHETLRTRIVDGAQVVDPADRHTPTIATHVTADVEATMAGVIARGFDLAADHPIRADLIVDDSTPGAGQVLLITAHHIAVDEWSATTLFAELAAAYNGDTLAPLPIQYVDHTVWQLDRLGDPADPHSRAHRQIGFWRTTLDGAPAELDLPYDRIRSHNRDHRGDQITVAVPADRLAALQSVARGEKATMFMLVHAAVAIALSASGAQDDIVIGTPSAGRTAAAADSLIGMFVNTLALRVDLGGDPTIREVIARARDTDVAAYAHADVPFDAVVTALSPARSLGRHPIFQTMVQYRDPIVAPRFSGLDATPLVPRTDTAKFDLTFEFAELPDGAGLRLRTEYATELFDPSTADAITERVVTALDLLTDDLSRRLGSIAWAPHRTAAVTPQTPPRIDLPHRTLTEILDASVAVHHDRIALTDNRSRLSYRDVDRRSAAIAHHLIADGVQPGDLVGLLMPRAADLPVAILGVLRAGAAYVPIDPDYPAERVDAIIADAAPRVVVDPDYLTRCTSPDQAPLNPACDVPAPDVPGPDVPAPDVPAPDVTAELGHLPSVTPQHPAYVIYTSGSTGTPKGVVVTHGNVVALLAATAGRVDVDSSDVWMLFHSYAFDFSVWEMWGPLATGGCLVIPDRTTTRSPDDVAALIAAERVTVLNQTPSAFFALEAADRAGGTSTDARRFDLSSLRLLIFGGEALDLSRLRDLLERYPALRPVNMYGITEITVHASHLPIDIEVIDRAVGSDVGEWLPGFTGHLFDSHLNPVPDGVAGELYLAGPQVAAGYLHRAALTATRFIADPHTPGGVLYRTGDVFRRTSSGAMVYAGRADSQVKVRGFRIELGEIRSVAALLPGVRDVAVITRPGAGGGAEILAYVVGSAIDRDAIREALAHQLPEHMIPAAITIVDAIPLTVNGKVDGDALPEPDRSTRVSRSPEGALEVAIAEIFVDSLVLPAGPDGRPHIGADDDFFALGGDSIISTTMVNRARRRGVVFTPRDVFEQRTVAGIASVARFAESTDTPSVPESSNPDDGPVTIPVLPVMHRLRELGGTIDRFNQSLVVDTPVGLTADRLVAALQIVIDSHEALRSRLSVVAGSVWSLQARPPGEVLAADVLDVVPLDSDADLEAVIARESDRAAACLAPTSGRMIAVTLLDPMPGLRGRVILVIHHLAVDGVSRRIVLDDLAAVDAALLRGDSAEEVAHSVREITPWHGFADAVARSAADPSLLNEAAHWVEVLAPGADLVPGMPPVGGTVGDQRARRVVLDSVTSTTLLTVAPAALGVGVTALFLGAMRVAAGAVLGTGDLLVDTERHGRDVDLPADALLDVSRTVGWFTTIAPLRLSAGDSGSVSATDDAIAAILDADRRWNDTPSTGTGFGILRYLSPQLSAALAQLSRPSVLLNYLGRFSVTGGVDWQPSAESDALAATPDPDLGCDHALEVDVVCLDGPDGPTLSATFAYLPTHLDTGTVERLGAAWRQCLTSVATSIESGVTP